MILTMICQLVKPLLVQVKLMEWGRRYRVRVILSDLIKTLCKIQQEVVTVKDLSLVRWMHMFDICRSESEWLVGGVNAC